MLDFSSDEIVVVSREPTSLLSSCVTADRCTGHYTGKHMSWVDSYTLDTISCKYFVHKTVMKFDDQAGKSPGGVWG